MWTERVMLNVFGKARKAYALRLATLDDLPVMLDLMQVFNADEPVGRSIGVTSEDMAVYDRLNTRRAIKNKLAVIAVHRRTNETVGLKLDKTYSRDTSKDSLHFPPGYRLPPRAQQVNEIVDQAIDVMFDMHPDIDRFFYGDSLVVNPAHRKQNLAMTLMAYNIRPEKLLRERIRYMLALPTNYATRKIFETYGFDKIGELENLRRRDGTAIQAGQSITLMTSDFRRHGIPPVTDFWEQYDD